MGETAAETAAAPKTDFDRFKSEETTQEFLQRTMKELSAKKVGETLSASEKANTDAQEILRKAEQAKLDDVLKRTNTSSGKINELFNDGWGIKPDKLAKLVGKTPEQLKEEFKTLNKGDIKKLGNALFQAENFSKEELKDTLPKLKQGLAAVIDTMVANGFSIENGEDIKFLEENGSENTKKLVALNKADGILKDYDGKTQLILQSKDNTISLQPAIKDGKLIEGLDLAKLNTIDTKADMKTVAANLEKSGINMADMKKNFSEAINNLMNSSNPMLKGLGELFKFFGKLFGFGSEGKEFNMETRKLNDNQKKELLKSMTKEKDRYTVSDFFDTKGQIKDDANSKKGFQEYMKDVYALLGKELPKDPKQILEYNDKLKDEVKVYEKSIDGKETGLITQARIGEILKKLDDNNTDTKKEESKTESAEKPVEKHKLFNLVGKLEGKNFKDLKKKENTNLVKEIQTALGMTGKEVDGKYGKNTIAAVKSFQEKELEMGSSADGKIGKKTIEAMKNKTRQAAPSIETKK